jgi:hypothetical protein
VRWEPTVAPTQPTRCEPASPPTPRSGAPPIGHCPPDPPPIAGVAGSVRSYAEAISQRTPHHRQAELTRLLLGVPRPVEDSDDRRPGVPALIPRANPICSRSQGGAAGWRGAPPLASDEIRSSVRSKCPFYCVAATGRPEIPGPAAVGTTRCCQRKMTRRVSAGYTALAADGASPAVAVARCVSGNSWVRW